MMMPQTKHCPCQDFSHWIVLGQIAINQGKSLVLGIVKQSN